MKKIKLMLNHQEGGVTHLAGETIEVSDEMYSYLQKAYAEIRGEKEEVIVEIMKMDKMIKASTKKAKLEDCSQDGTPMDWTDQ